ncbi:MAG: hypothetical protein VW338_10560 [Rhodospirillaceae bacterium]
MRDSDGVGVLAARQQRRRQFRHDDPLAGAGWHGGLDDDQRPRLQVRAQRVDGGAETAEIDLRRATGVADIEVDVDDGDVGEAERLGLSDGDQVARRVAGGNGVAKCTVGGGEGKAALIERGNALGAAAHRQIDADDREAGAAVGLSGHGDGGGHGGADETQSLDADHRTPGRRGHGPLDVFEVGNHFVQGARFRSHSARDGDGAFRCYISAALMGVHSTGRKAAGGEDLLEPACPEPLIITGIPPRAAAPAPCTHERGTPVARR